MCWVCLLVGLAVLVTFTFYFELEVYVNRFHVIVVVAVVVVVALVRGPRAQRAGGVLDLDPFRSLLVLLCFVREFVSSDRCLCLLQADLP